MFAMESSAVVTEAELSLFRRRGLSFSALIEKDRLKSIQSINETDPQLASSEIVDKRAINSIQFLIDQWNAGRSSFIAGDDDLQQSEVAFFLHLLKRSNKVCATSLIVVTPSEIIDWQSKFSNFPELSVSIICTADGINSINDQDVIITTFKSLCIDEISRYVRSREWLLLVVDEAKKLLARNTYRMFASISVDTVILMGNSRIKLSIYELWPLLRFLDPEEFQFSHTYISQYPFRPDVLSIQSIHEIIAPYFFIVSKPEEKQYSVIELELSPIQKIFYRNTYIENKQFLCQPTQRKDEDFKPIYQKLSLIVSHPFLIQKYKDICLKSFVQTFPSKSSDLDVPCSIWSSAKIKFLLACLRENAEENCRIAIISSIPELFDIIEQLLVFEGFMYEKLLGDSHIQERSQNIIIDRNQPLIFLVSSNTRELPTRATAVDTAIVMDPNISMESLITSGLSKEANIIWLISKDTHEASLIGTDMQREGMIEEVMEIGATKFFKEETIEMDKSWKFWQAILKNQIETQRDPNAFNEMNDSQKECIASQSDLPNPETDRGQSQKNVQREGTYEIIYNRLISFGFFNEEFQPEQKMFNWRPIAKQMIICAFSLIDDDEKPIFSDFKERIEAFTNEKSNISQEFDAQFFSDDPYNFLKSTQSSDNLFVATSFLLREQLPPKFYPASSLISPPFWGPLEDITFLSSLCSNGFTSLNKSASNAIKHELVPEFVPRNDWLEKKRDLLIFETLQIKGGYLPPSTKLPLKPQHLFVSDIGVISIANQLRALKGLYLYGYPLGTTTPFEYLRIVTNLQFIKLSTFSSFISAIMKKCAELRSDFPICARDFESNFDISWIPNYEIYSVAENLSVLFRIREIFQKGKHPTRLPKWSIASLDWGPSLDWVLIECVAKYGFISFCTIAKHLASLKGHIIDEKIVKRDQFIEMLTDSPKKAEYCETYDFMFGGGRVERRIKTILKAIEGKNEQKAIEESPKEETMMEIFSQQNEYEDKATVISPPSSLDTTVKEEAQTSHEKTQKEEEKAKFHDSFLKESKLKEREAKTKRNQRIDTQNKNLEAQMNDKDISTHKLSLSNNSCIVTIAPEALKVSEKTIITVKEEEIPSENNELFDITTPLIPAYESSTRPLTVSRSIKVSGVSLTFNCSKLYISEESFVSLRCIEYPNISSISTNMEIAALSISHQFSALSCQSKEVPNVTKSVIMELFSH